MHTNDTESICNGRHNRSERQDQPWRVRSLFEELYLDEELPTAEMADELGCSRYTVLHWIRKHGITPRDGHLIGPTKTEASFFTSKKGYEMSSSFNDTVRIHRLVAVAEYGFEAVCGDDIHHRNGIPWDNRPTNIEVLESSEHSAIHAEERSLDEPWHDEETLRELYAETESLRGVADELDCTEKTVAKWMGRFGIERIDPYEGAPWRDEETLRELYDKTGSVEVMADELGCSSPNIIEWMDQFGIERTDPREDAPWRDEEILRSAYARKTQSELAEEWGCNQTTVSRWVRKHGIGERQQAE